MTVLLIGPPDVVLLGVCRLKIAFSSVEPGQPVPVPDRPGYVRVVAVVKF
ncbi:hypothetical protein [Streptacidiphilus carbonis]|nr:hypothetical protein [Streptacidiphilus carbonis]